MAGKVYVLPLTEGEWGAMMSSRCPQITMNCPVNCPALGLRDERRIEWISYCEDLRRDECNRILSIHGRIRLYILAESIPYRRFIYDPGSNYAGGRGLRANLCCELLKVKCPVTSCSRCRYFNQLLDYLRNKGILIVDCALCPLHKMGLRPRDRRLAATLCLNNNTIAYLNVTPNAPIITIFPRNYGFLKKEKPYVQRRVIREFNFSNLTGLKDMIGKILRNAK